MTDFARTQTLESYTIPGQDLVEICSTLIELRKAILAFQEKFNKSPKYLALSRDKYGHLVFDTLAKKNSLYSQSIAKVTEILSQSSQKDGLQIENFILPRTGMSFREYPSLFEGIQIIVIPGENITELLDLPEILAWESDIVEYSENKADKLIKNILRQIWIFACDRQWQYSPSYIVISPEDYTMLELHCRNQGAYSWQTAEEVYGYLFGRYIPEKLDIVVHPRCGEPVVVLDAPDQYVHLIKNKPA